MRSFQLKITCWIAAGFFALMFGVLVLFNVYAIHEVAHTAKKRMKTISRSILEELASGAVRSGPIPDEVVRAIDEKLSFVDREGTLSYAVVSKEHRLLYNTPGFNLPLEEEFLSKEHKRLFLQSVRSGDDAEDLLSVWHFLFRYEGQHFVIFVSDSQSYELLEKFVHGLGICLLLALALAVPSGLFLSKKVLRPLEAIDATAQRVRQGHLEARIATIPGADEIARLADALNATFAELEQSFARIRQFSADAAHELKTPLTAIRGTVEVCLSRERSPAEYQAVLADCAEEVAGLSRMVTDLLLLASPGDESRKRRFAVVDCSDLVRDVIDRLEAITEGKRVRVEQRIEEQVHVSGDETLLQRLCYNLVHNAVRFSESGSTATVSLQRQDGNVLLTVEDHGIGIRPDDRDRIFERFYQVDEGRGSGTGLGLAIAQWVAELHGGRIDVESRPGDGSRFVVTLPSGEGHDEAF